VGEGRRESDDDRAATDQTTGHKLTVSEAAEALGISGDAVRSRIKRGTLPTVREGGRVLVVMGADDRPTAQAQPTHPRLGEDRLYEEMQARISYLERQVEEEREARRRADTLLARLMDRLPELEAAPETLGEPETAAQEPERGEPRGEATASERTGERRPWWQRWFGS
jgi:excisionase family DNA binding protein